MLKFINRLRRKIAGGITPQNLWSNKTHFAYPEYQTFPDGSWQVRFYAYEPFAWIFQGTRYNKQPAFPEPNMAHPTTYAEGHAPENVVEAWKKYYAERPEPVTLLEEFKGQAKNTAKAKKAAFAVVQKNLHRYLRDSV